jgi:hypothetical protein
MDGGPGSPHGASASVPAEGSQIGDTKGGGSGGHRYLRTGANWNDAVNHWTGATGVAVLSCISAGGAAGFNGNGADGDLGGDRRKRYTGFDAAPN